MKKTLYFAIAYCLIGSFLTSCSDDDTSLPYNDEELICTFVLDSTTMDGSLSEEEIRVLNDCRDAAITDRDSIMQNLTGATWVLEGMALPWGQEGQLPCAHATFDADELVYHYEDAVWDTTLVLQWDIVSDLGSTQNPNWTLVITPITQVPGLHGMEHFCPDHMWFNHLPLDGTMQYFTRRSM